MAKGLGEIFHNHYAGESPSDQNKGQVLNLFKFLFADPFANVSMPTGPVGKPSQEYPAGVFGPMGSSYPTGLGGPAVPAPPAGGSRGKNGGKSKPRVDGKGAGGVGSSAGGAGSASVPVTSVYDTLLATLAGNQAQQQQALSNYTKDVIGYLNGTTKPIAGDYQGAIDQQNAFAKTYAGLMNQANPNAAIQSDLRMIGAPGAQRSQVANDLKGAYGTAAADLYAGGGLIPNSQFAQDKAGALAFARAMPTYAGLYGQQLAAALAQSQAKDTQAIQLAKANAQAKLAAATVADTTKPAATRNVDGYVKQWNPSTGKYDITLGKAGTPGSKTGRSFTAKQISDMTTTAYDSAKQVAMNPNGLQDENGNWVIQPNMTPADVLRDLIGHGIPFRIAVRQVAKFFPVANAWYGKGLKQARATKGKK